jgi:hypothetical protein
LPRLKHIVDYCLEFAVCYALFGSEPDKTANFKYPHLYTITKKQVDYKVSAGGPDGKARMTGAVLGRNNRQAEFSPAKGLPSCR